MAARLTRQRTLVMTGHYKLPPLHWISSLLIYAITSYHQKGLLFSTSPSRLLYLPHPPSSPSSEKCVFCPWRAEITLSKSVRSMYVSEFVIISKYIYGDDLMLFVPAWCKKWNDFSRFRYLRAGWNIQWKKGQNKYQNKYGSKHFRLSCSCIYGEAQTPNLSPLVAVLLVNIHTSIAGLSHVYTQLNLTIPAFCLAKFIMCSPIQHPLSEEMGRILWSLWDPVSFLQEAPTFCQEYCTLYGRKFRKSSKKEVCWVGYGGIDDWILAVYQLLPSDTALYYGRLRNAGIGS